MSVSQYQYFLYFFRSSLPISCVFTFLRVSISHSPNKHCSLICDIVTGIYKHVEITNNQSLAIHTDTLLCIE